MARKKKFVDPAFSEIEPDEELKGASADSKYRGLRGVLPRRNAERGDKPIEFATDPLELRAYGSPIADDKQRSVLERIVAKRLVVIWGDRGVDWEYQLGIAEYSADFAIYNRPSQKILVLEVQGAQWHRPMDNYSDSARAMDMIARGYDWTEILEWEIRMGDEYTDQRLIELIGGVGRNVYITDKRWMKEVRYFR